MPSSISSSKHQCDSHNSISKLISPHNHRRILFSSPTSNPVMVAKRKRDDSGGALPQSPEHPGQQSDSEVEPGTTSSGHSIHDPSDRPPSGGGDASHKQEHQVDARAELEFSDRRIQLVRKKICQYEKKLKPALKVACRFEHQKLVKRLRRSQSADQDDVKGKPVDVSKIKDEMEELKVRLTSDISVISRHSLPWRIILTLIRPPEHRPRLRRSSSRQTAIDPK